MKDERIIKQLNQAKGVIMYYIFFSSILLLLLKYLIYNLNLENYYVEIYIFIITGSTILLKNLFFRKNDERMELIYEKLLNIFFSVLLFGGFFIHFYSNSNVSLGSQFPVNFTSTFILIGVIVFIFQLKKRAIYANYKWLDEDKKTYITNIIKRILLFGIMFSINIIPYIINQSNILIGFLTIGISYISLSFSYFFFSLYEWNHYKESLLIEENNATYLTRNASLFLIVPLIYSFFSIVVNFYIVYLILISASIDTQIQAIAFRRIIWLLSIDIALLSSLAYFMIYFYIKKLNGPNSLSKLIKIYAISVIPIRIISFSTNIVLSFLHSHETIMLFINIDKYLGYSFTIFFTIISVLILIQLKQLKVPFTTYFIVSIISPYLATIFNYFTFKYNSVFLLVLATICQILSMLILFIFLKKLEKEPILTHTPQTETTFI